MCFKEERGLGRCGKVCALCHIEGREDCPGCAAGGGDEGCAVRECAAQRNLGGCHVCQDYPCGKDTPPQVNRRNKAFLRYAHEFGERALLERLRLNEENGLIYQNPGEKAGDYDVPQTELEIYELLRYGRGGRSEGAGEEIEITVKPLSPELMADYFDFFNYRAFTNNPPWGGCYCTGFQATKAEEAAQLWEPLKAMGGGNENFMRALRRVAARQITSGALRGYLAYTGGLPIGWCNANDKANYPEESANGFRLHAPAEKREKAVICFEIAPEYRGKGVASALLSRVLADAKSEGYAAVEGFPRAREYGKLDEWAFTGPNRLYEKLGFKAIERPDGSVVMRKELTEA